MILGDFDCTLDKIDRYGGNKTQRLYRCGSNYALSKLIVGNGLEDLWRRKNLDFSEFTNQDSSSGAKCRIGKAYSGIKIATIPRLII